MKKRVNDVYRYSLHCRAETFLKIVLLKKLIIFSFKLNLPIAIIMPIDRRDEGRTSAITISPGLLKLTL